MRIKILLSILIVSFATSSYSQTVSEIINKHIEALGGVRALKNVQTKQVELELQLDSGPMKAMMYNQRPGFYKSEMEMPDGNKVITLVNASGGWILMGENESEISAEHMADLRINELDLDGPLVEYEKKGIKVSLVGRENANEKEAFKLKLELPNQTVQWYWIDAGTYLPLRFSRSVITGMGSIDLEREFLEFKKVNDVNFPVRFRSSFGMNEYTTIVKSIKINEPIGQQVFEKG